MAESPGKLQRAILRFRNQLAFHEATPQLVILGVVVGLLASVIIIAFRLLIETPLSFAFAGEVGNFESLSLRWRFLLPVTGALLLGLALHQLDKRYQQISVTHVLDRLHRHQGHLPMSNMLWQFCAGIVALVSGQSVGREGPGVHLGAGAGSLLGQWLRLPNNSLRILIACGAAAAIAATFNTPMAGVIFAMEVILMEYTISSFIPIIIASVIGSALSQLVFGADINVVSLSGQTISLAELPFLIVSGLLVSVAAATFIKIHMSCLRWQSKPVLLRFTLMGLLTGAVAMFVPQIMGMGYDTINGAIAGQFDIQLLLLIVVAKLIVTAVVTGLGMTGGLIGPTLVIGACLGGLLGVLGNLLVDTASASEFYVVLGMVAMMGAVLNAPLAALVAILELSYSPEIIFPSMLIVVVACLGVQLGFRYHGIFNEQLRHHGLDIYSGPGKGFLSRVGVMSVMNRSFELASPPLSTQQLETFLAGEQLWLIMPWEKQWHVLSTADMARLHARLVEASAQQQGRPDVTGNEAADQTNTTEGLSDPLTGSLPDHPLTAEELVPWTLETASIDARATLHEASSKIRETGAKALLVLENSPYSVHDQSRWRALHSAGQPKEEKSDETGKIVVGVLTRETIVNFYGM